MKARHRTTQIKPATRDALKDQFALAADEIEYLRWAVGQHYRALEWYRAECARLKSRRWWQWWRK